MRNASQRTGSASGVLSTSPSNGYPRRRFLLALGAGGAGAAAAVASPGLAAQSAAAPNSARETTSGYRETEHVRDYYNSARL
jgi:hypothetical protein